MGYVDSNLIAGELVVYRAKLHWIRYFWTAFWLFLGVSSLTQKSPAGAFFIIIGIALGAIALLDQVSSEFVLTNRRLYLKQGIIRHSSVELLLAKVESLQVHQGILGGMFNFGTVIPVAQAGPSRGSTRSQHPKNSAARSTSRSRESRSRAPLVSPELARA